MNAIISRKDLGDVDRARNVTQQMIAIGGDFAWLGRIIEEKLKAFPDVPRERRDQAIAALANNFIGSRWETAENVRIALRRYAASAWKRDRNLSSHPENYASNPEKLALFAAMQADAKAGDLSRKQIDRILKNHCSDTRFLGHENSVSMSKMLEHRDGQERNGHHMLKNPEISDAQFIGALKSTPIGQKVVIDEKQRVIAERQAWIDEIKRLDKTANVDLPKLQNAIDLEIEAVRASERALRVANEKLNAAIREKGTASFQYDTTRRNLETRLLNSSVDAAITAFCRDLISDAEATRRKFSGQTEFGLHPVTRRRIEEVYNNKASINRRLAAIQAALDEAERLRLAADQNDTVSRLDILRANLPVVDGVLTHDTGERG